MLLYAAQIVLLLTDDVIGHVATATDVGPSSAQINMRRWCTYVRCKLEIVRFEVKVESVRTGKYSESCGKTDVSSDRPSTSAFLSAIVPLEMLQLVSRINFRYFPSSLVNIRCSKNVISHVFRFSKKWKKTKKNARTLLETKLTKQSLAVYK